MDSYSNALNLRQKSSSTSLGCPVVKEQITERLAIIEKRMLIPR